MGRAFDRDAFRRAVAPVMHDLLAHRAEEIDRTGKYPADVHQAFAAQGWLSSSLPVDLGGAAHGLSALTLLTE